MYKYDLHVHTSQTSPCASMSGAEQARAYKELGFTGIVITDHYYDGFFKNNSFANWKEAIDKYFSGYFDAKKEGDKIGLDVFQSAEVTVASIKKDYLVYGLKPDFFYQNEKLYELSESELIEKVHSCGGIIFAAHPFRDGDKECYPYGAVDGVEVINGNPRTDNKLGMKYAKERNLLMCSGSDAHNIGDAGLAGITTAVKIESITHLADILRSGDFRFVDDSSLYY